MRNFGFGFGHFQIQFFPEKSADVSFHLFCVRFAPNYSNDEIISVSGVLNPFIRLIQRFGRSFQSFSYAECGFPHSGYRSGSLALYLIHEFLFLNFQIHRISTLSFRLLSIDKSDNMLHSPSGFPSRISCRIIGCDFSSLDTFTYCLLKAVFHKYHAAEFIMRWRLLGAHSYR